MKSSETFGLRDKSNSYPGEKGGKQTEGKKRENEGMIERKVSLCTQFLSYQNRREHALQGREGLPSLPSSPSLHGHLDLYSPPSTSFLSAASPSQSQVPPGPPPPFGSQWRAEPQGFMEHRAEPCPPNPTITGGSGRDVPAVDHSREGPVPRGSPRPSLLPILVASLQQHSTTGSSMPYVFRGLAFWGDVFTYNCPAKPIFCSFFL